MKDSKLKHYAHSTAVLVYKCVKADNARKRFYNNINICDYIGGRAYQIKTNLNVSTGNAQVLPKLAFPQTLSMTTSAHNVQKHTHRVERSSICVQNINGYKQYFRPPA